MLSEFRKLFNALQLGQFVSTNIFTGFPLALAKSRASIIGSCYS
jgi:hypothetical protein